MPSALFELQIVLSRMFSRLEVNSVEETSLTGVTSVKSVNSSVPLKLQPMEIGSWKIVLRHRWT